MSAIFSFVIRHQKQNQTKKKEKKTHQTHHISHVRETKSVQYTLKPIMYTVLAYWFSLRAEGEDSDFSVPLHEHVVLIVVVKLLP